MFSMYFVVSFVMLVTQPLLWVTKPAVCGCYPMSGIVADIGQSSKRYWGCTRTGRRECPALSLVIGHHRSGRRHDDACHSRVRRLQCEVADRAGVGDVARRAPADMRFARPRIASAIAIAMATAPGARSASNTAIAPARFSTRMLGAGLIALLFSRSR